jgi:hypothetical protein
VKVVSLIGSHPVGVVNTVSNKCQVFVVAFFFRAKEWVCVFDAGKMFLVG